MRVITTCQNNRPEYTAQMLEYLAKCRGIHNYHLIACIEPGNDEVLKLIRDFNKVSLKTIVVNEKVLGCNLNTMNTMFHGFSYYNTILHVEDDIILADDALHYYETWASSRDNAFSFTLYNKIFAEQYIPEMYNKIGFGPGFNPWGFGIRRKSFAKALTNECFTMCGEYLSWDCRINEMCHKESLVNRYMYLSRANNIGALNGVHVRDAEWHTANQYLEFWKETL